MLRFACPKCKTVLQAADAQAGAVIGCPTCKAPLRAPPAAPPAPPVAPAPVAVAPPPAPPPPPAAPAKKYVMSGVQVFGAAALREAAATARETWGQTRRLAAHGRGLWRERGLRRAAVDAAHTLGERMVQVGAGDPALRARIAALEENIRQARAAMKPAGALRAERDHLLRQLAGPALALELPLIGVEKEHMHGREALAALLRHAEAAKTARAALPPRDGAGWRRVAVGYGTLCLCGLAALLFLGWLARPAAPAGGHSSGDRPAAADDVSGPPPGTVLVVEKPLWGVKGGPYWGSVSSLVFVNSGKTLFALGGNGESKLFTVEGGQEMPLKGFMVRSEEFSLSGLSAHWEDASLFARYLADDRHAAIQDGIRSIGRQSAAPLDYQNKFLSPNGKFVATAINPPPLRLWEAETAKVLTLKQEPEDTETDGSYHALSIAFSPDSKTLAVWGKSGLKIWDLDTGKKVAVLTREPPSEPGLESPILFSPDGALLAANRPIDHTPPVLWDCATWQPRCTLQLEGSGNFRVRAFSPDHKLAVTTDGSTRFQVTTWNTADGKMRNRTEAVDAHEVFFSPDGASIVAGGGDYFVKNEPMHDVLFWDAASGRLTRRITDEMVTTAALAPNGKLMATGNMNAEIKLWDLTRSKAVPFESEASGSGAKDDPIKLTALRLYSDYQKNPVLADQKYARKWLAVTGEVTTRDDTPPGFAGMILIGLRGSPAEGERVSCYFDRLNAGMLKRLDDKDYPPIIGECLGTKEIQEASAGRKTTVLLTHCIIPPK